jgi:hypothetical protein
MELNDEQRRTVAAWANRGLGLADIQRQLREEFGISMTYMEVRFLILELGLQVKDKETPTEEIRKDKAVETAATEPDETDLPGRDTFGNAVSVEVDRVMKPGSIVSGTVVFSDGVKAAWSLDQFGRLALDADRPGYTPGREDIAAFQKELRAALESRGF